MKLTINKIIIFVLFAHFVQAEHKAIHWQDISGKTSDHSTSISGTIKATVTVVPDPDLPSTNIASKIAEAINGLPAEGGTVHLTAGHYYIGPSTMGVFDINSKSNITIIGDGDGTIIDFPYGTGSPYLFLIKGGSTNITFDGIYFKGSELSDAGLTTNTNNYTAIKLNKCSNVCITNCHFYGFYTGAIVLEDSTTNIKISNNLFENVADRPSNGDYGVIHVKWTASFIEILHNRFVGVKHSGISTYQDPQYLTISDNFITFYSNSCQTMGIYCPQGLRNSLIANNSIIGAYNEAIDLSSGGQPLDNNIIIGNQLKGNYTGITLNHSGCATGAHNNSIINNFIDGNGTCPRGIYLNYSYKCTISGNIVKQCTLYGIDMEDASSTSVIASNIISLTNNTASTCIGGNGRTVIESNILSDANCGIWGQSSDGIQSIIHNRFSNITNGIWIRAADTSRIYSQDNDGYSPIPQK